MFLVVVVVVVVLVLVLVLASLCLSLSVCDAQKSKFVNLFSILCPLLKAFLRVMLPQKKQERRHRKRARQKSILKHASRCLPPFTSSEDFCAETAALARSRVRSLLLFLLLFLFLLQRRRRRRQPQRKQQQQQRRVKRTRKVVFSRILFENRTLRFQTWKEKSCLE